LSHQVILRCIVALQFIFTFVFVAVDFYIVESLPNLLKEYLISEENRDLTTFEIVFALTSIPLLLIYVVSAVGLFFLKPWAKTPYVFVNIAMVLTVPFLGPTVEHAITSTIGSIESVLLGLTFGLLYFSDTLSLPNKPFKQDK